MKIKRILFLWLLLNFNAMLNAQNTWNWIGPDNDHKVICFGVKALNNKIYTTSSTINYSDSIPYVNSNLIEFNNVGDIIFDSVCGNINQTFVFYQNVRSNYSLGNFCYPIAFRYPNSVLTDAPAILIMDTLYNTKLNYVISTDTNSILVGPSFISKISNNRYLLVTTTQPIINSDYNAQVNLYLIDSMSNIIQSKVIKKTNYLLNLFTMHVFENNFYAIINKISPTPTLINPTDLLIYKLDSLFNVLDSFSTVTNNWYYNNTSAVLSNGDFVVGGVFSDGIGPGGVIWQKKYLSKFDKDLNIIWTKYFGRRSQNNSITRLKITSDGNIVGCGNDGITTTTVNGDTIGHITGCIFKFTANGDSIWMHNYQALDNPLYGEENILLDIDEMPDGGFVACGKATTFTPFTRRGWLIRVDENGCLTTDCVSNIKEVEPYSRNIIYPNPSSKEINSTNLELIKNYELFGYYGNLITKGNTFPISIENLTVGLYFLKIVTKDEMIITQKIIKQ